MSAQQLQRRVRRQQHWLEGLLAELPPSVQEQWIRQLATAWRVQPLNSSSTESYLLRLCLRLEQLSYSNPSATDPFEEATSLPPPSPMPCSPFSAGPSQRGPPDWLYVRKGPHGDPSAMLPADVSSV